MTIQEAFELLPFAQATSMFTILGRSNVGGVSMFILLNVNDLQK